jgi:hypothetical protein
MWLSALGVLAAGIESAFEDLEVSLPAAESTGREILT